jgi:RimJ/RimL family protein N-acetyltransferase
VAHFPGFPRPHQPKSLVLAEVKTAHLLLRPYTAADLPALFRFMSDRLAMQHTYAAPCGGPTRTT